MVGLVALSSEFYAPFVDRLRKPAEVSLTTSAEERPLPKITWEFSNLWNTASWVISMGYRAGEPSGRPRQSEERNGANVALASVGLIVPRGSWPVARGVLQENGSE